MTFDETIDLLRICKAEWPQSFRGMSKQDAEARLHLWAQMFADDDAGLVGAALKSLIVAGNREFAPGVGQIKEQMRKLTAPDELDEAEAWGKIRTAVGNGLYGSVEEFDRLPPICQKLVGSPSQLREWAMVDSDELQTVVASNVQRAYRTMRQREQERAKLPAEVRAVIGDLAQRLALGAV